MNIEITILRKSKIKAEMYLMISFQLLEKLSGKSKSLKVSIKNLRLKKKLMQKVIYTKSLMQSVINLS